MGPSQQGLGIRDSGFAHTPLPGIPPPLESLIVARQAHEEHSRVRPSQLHSAMSGAAMLDALWIDIRHSFRGLRRSPGFSLVVTATFALAIGANTAVFSLFNAIVLRPVSAFDPDRLIAISTTDMRTVQPGYIYAETFTAFRAQQRSFSTLSMYSSAAPRIQARDAVVDAGIEGVMPEYFGLLDARLAAGRLLADTDNALTTAGTPVVVITDRLWRRLFDGDPRAVGETLKIDWTPVTIVGVTAPG